MKHIASVALCALTFAMACGLLVPLSAAAEDRSTPSLESSFTAPVTVPPQGPLLAAATIYHGNTNTKVFHEPGCRYYNCPHCTREFTSRDQALAAGYRPCRVCYP